MPASVERAFKSAPLEPSAISDISLRFTPGSRFIPEVWILNMASRASLVGRGISITLSKRPGRSKAGSSISRRLVAAISLTSPRASNPSISARICISVLCTSRSPLVAPSMRRAPMASSSSMNMMAGDLLLASSNSSRTSRAPSPMYFCTNSEPTTLRNAASVLWATALASMVLPVPGGP